MVLKVLDFGLIYSSKINSQCVFHQTMHHFKKTINEWRIVRKISPWVIKEAVEPLAKHTFFVPVFQHITDLCVTPGTTVSSAFYYRPASYLFIAVFGFVIVVPLAVAYMYNPSNSSLAPRSTQPSIIPAHNNSSGTARSIFSPAAPTHNLMFQYTQITSNRCCPHTPETLWNLKIYQGCSHFLNALPSVLSEGSFCALLI